jgi:predicted alpha/beta-hydrolase family hydrolase
MPGPEQRRAPKTFHVTCRAAGEGVAVSARVYEAEGPPIAWVILAPGAGAGHDSPFMVSYARELASRALTTVTFNFPYIERGRRVPDPAGTLESCWKTVIRAARELAGAKSRLIAGGKSMGGRIASQAAADADVSGDLSGLVFLGYPLHPPGRPEQLRTAHWPGVRLPALFVQGSRDSFASPSELRENLVQFGGRAAVMIVEGGDHSFKVPRASGRSQDTVHAEIHDAIAEWVGNLLRPAGSTDSDTSRHLPGPGS